MDHARKQQALARYQELFQGDPDYEELTGDLDISYGDASDNDEEDESPVSLNVGDVSDILSGAPVAKVVAKKKSGPTTPKSARVSKAANKSPLSVPGAAMSAATIPPLFVDNAKIVSFGTERNVSGAILKYNIESHVRDFPEGTIRVAIAGAGPQNSTDVAADENNLPAGFDFVSVPIIFTTITASALNARAGAQYRVELTARTDNGATVTHDTWVIERINATLPVKFAYIPYIRWKDRIIPVRAQFGNSRGTPPAVVHLTLKVWDVLTDETVQMVLPGLDSQELAAFCKAFNLSVGLSL